LAVYPYSSLEGPAFMYEALHTPTATRIAVFAVAIFLLLMSSPIAGAQQPSVTLDADTVKALLQRVQDLESQVKELKVQMQTLSAGQNAPAQLATAQSPAGQAVNAPDAALAQTSMPDHAGMEVNGPRLQIRGYGDASWHASSRSGATNTFSLGQLNLFMTSRISERMSFLAETVIEADTATNEFSIEPERLQVTYNAGDWLTLSVGRYHSQIGFYNTAYHHSALMQTTQARPFMFAFEDQGGILPIHSVGVSATGTLVNSIGLHYVAEIANGRTARKEVNPVQSTSDDNNGKSFNLGFFVRPSQVPGMQFGFSNYHDHVTPPAQSGVVENILAGHVVYQTPQFEFMNEAVLQRHTLDSNGSTTNIPGFYSQISRRFGSYRPYFRYEYVNVPARDPLFADIGLLHGPKAGLRYSLSEFAAFKVEVGRDMRRGVSGANLFGTQLSFAF